MKRRFSLLFLLCAVAAGLAQTGGELRFCLRSDPKTFNPMMASDQPSEIIRYLTGGVLIRMNRKTQQLEPELALSWRESAGGRRISFKLRQDVLFSDGTPFSAEDVAYTMKALVDPALKSPIGDSFRAGGAVSATVEAKDRVTITFENPVAGLDGLFDQVSIVSSRSPNKEKAVLGPFRVSGQKLGVEVTLERNPSYWKRDEAGRRLPYVDSIRLEIQQNRETELLRFRRGQLHLINDIDPETFDRLASDSKDLPRDAGPSLDPEMVWFNQVPAAPLPAYKKAWFRSRAFRRAISASIKRDDICRVVYRGRAVPAAGPVSPANLFWFNQALKPHAYDPAAALKELAREGFVRKGNSLYDREGNAVEFSIVTNSGNKMRERMAALIQQDLLALGIRVNVTPLDFMSLVERITRTFNYEACLLGLTNIDVEPNAQMNVWLSSAANHQWNPSQKAPETKWEAEIDRLMKIQASTINRTKRKAAFDRVQQIVWDEAPFVYLVTRNALSAVSTQVRNCVPVVLTPQTYWNADRLALANPGKR